MITNFQTININPRLNRFIERIFIIESSGKLPSADLKLIVPNACPKLVIPFKNGLIGTSKEWEHLSKEHTITVIGISDIPATVDFQHEQAAGNITVEFTPLGAYRFLHFNWREGKNRIWNYADMDQKTAEQWEEILGNEECPLAKTTLIQQLLITRLNQQSEDNIFDFCVQKIRDTKGKIGIKELEKQTGYSARYLNMKFHHRIGISPKNLASIIRFQQYYRSVSTNSERFFLKKEFYDYYYDQAHFIKDFKRFTGHAPVSLSKSDNNYDKLFYTE